MTKQEWALRHGISEQGMDVIEVICKMFNGKVTKVKETSHANKSSKWDW